MKDAKHTPGPWETRPSHDGSGHTVYQVEGGPICYTNELVEDVPVSKTGQPTRKANARLIAAAPGLAGALKLLLFAIENCEGYALPLQVLKAAEEAAEALAKSGLLTDENAAK